MTAILQYSNCLVHDEYDQMELDIDQSHITIEVKDGYKGIPNSKVTLSHNDFCRIYDLISSYKRAANIMNIKTEETQTCATFSGMTNQLNQNSQLS